MTIIGGLGDQTIYYVWEQISGLFSIKDPILAGFFPYQFRFRYLINPIASNQPLLAVVSSVITTLFTYDFLLLITFILNLFFSYMFFKRFKVGWVYILLFCLSAYFISHFGIHIALSQIWVFPMFFNILFKWKDKLSLKSCLVIGLAATLTILVSNYYGFFILLFLGIYSISELLVRKKRVYFLSILVATILSAIFLLPYFKAAFLGRGDVNSIALERNIEDPFHFSSRPWYFVVPPVKNPFLGEFGKSLVERFASTGYFLSDDYFEIEHMGNYLGLFFTISVILSSIYVLRKGSLELREEVGSLVITLLVIFLFMLPPFFTISGVEIYTPGFLVFKFFPMFRVTARMSVLILFVLLIVLGKNFDFLYEKLGEKRRLLKLLSIFILVVTIFETYVPLKIVKIDKAPEIYEYLDSSTPKASVFAIYPYGKSQDAFFWLPTHNRLFINCRDFSYGDFDAEVFTKSLNSEIGLSKLKELNIDYVVVSSDVSGKDIAFFQDSSLLNLEKEFTDYFLFIVN